MRGACAEYSAKSRRIRMSSLSPQPLPPEGAGSPELSEPFSTILEEIAGELELRPLLTSIITRACGLLGADEGAIGLYVPRRHVIQVEAILGLPPSEIGVEQDPGEGLLGRVLASGKPVILDRYDELDRMSLPEFASEACIGIPIPG